MKKHFILAAMAMTALFSACSNEDPINEEKTSVPVSFTIGGIDSRTTTATDFSTTFDNGDAIGITGTNVSPAMSNAKYNVSVSNSEATITPDGSDSFTLGEQEAIFNAYYPYAEDFTGAFAVKTNQNEEKALAMSDFLTATAKGDKDNAEVQLDFKHRLVLVQVQLSGISNVSSVTLKNAQTNVTFTNGTDGETQGAVALATDATFSDIIMSEQTANELYWAIIPAQKIAASDLFIVSTSDGKNYKYTTNAETTYTEGTYAQYKLTLSGGTEQSTLVEYKAVIISKWNAGVNVLDGTLEEDKLEITATLPAVGNITTLINGRSDLTNTGWGAYNLTSATVVEDAENGNYIQAVGNATAGAWGSQGLYYWAGSENLMSPNESYILTFKAKSESSGQISVMVMKLNSNTVFPIVDVTTSSDISSVTATGTINSKTLTSTWTEYKFKITPNQSMTGGYGNLNNASTVETNSDICIAIKGNSTSSNYDIKDVTFVRY